MAPAPVSRDMHFESPHASLSLKRNNKPAERAEEDSSPSSSCPSPPSPSSIELDTLPRTAKPETHYEILKTAAKTASFSPARLERVANALRILCADAVEHARSGHPGMPLGMAPTAATLWLRHLRFNPSNPTWINRDRFVLSAGHGSILLYSLLHLFGYESISMADLKSFRKRGSRAAGHPENTLTPGVEVTTGALGQGIANAVGLAMAETYLAASYNQPDAPSIVDHFTYCIVGDGCLMEGVASEAASLAGHWELGKLIVFYDDNAVSIEGSTDLAFREDVGARFRAYGWHVVHVQDGNTDYNGIQEAIESAKAETTRPSLIKVTTTIGYGAPSKEGTNAAHGSCLGAENISALRTLCGWTAEPFDIPTDILDQTRRAVDVGEDLESSWNRSFNKYRAKYPDLARQFESTILRGELREDWAQKLRDVGNAFAKTPEARATRSLSHAAINSLAANLPHFIGGSADLGPSNLTHIVKEPSYSPTTRAGRNMHFGVREHAMGSIANGIALHSVGLVPYCATFLVFSDYMRAAIRTAALSNAGTIFVMTHDSVMLGEDGPTHQPVEHLASLRAIPNLLTIRPADGVEVAAAYELAVRSRGTPSVVVLSRQRFEVSAECSHGGALRGGYVHSDDSDGTAPAAVVIATGSELGLASRAAEAVRQRRGRGRDGARVRVVSMPCVEQFERQPRAYRAAVLGGEPEEGEDEHAARARTLVVEAGARACWWRYATRFVTVDSFGLSAPAHDVADALGLTASAVEKEIEEILTRGALCREGRV